MKKLYIIVIGLIICFPGMLVLAQNGIEISGEQTIGVRNLNLDVNSSKFNEYRDIRNGFFIPDLRFNLNNKTNWFLSLNGGNLLLDDQFIRIQLGDYGNRWNLYFFNNKTPHRFSNKSQTPFYGHANGLFTVPDRVQIYNDANPATGTPSLVPTRGEMAVNDSLIALYVQKYLHPFNLNVQRELIAASLDIPRLGPVSLNLTYADEKRSGNRITFGPIGDRPPRTLNVQMPEPVNYITREVLADAEFHTNIFQARLNYTFSVFENRIDHMTWENIFFRPVGSIDYISAVAGTPRNVSNFGRRSLAPDNLYNNISLAVGLNLPFSSRLTSTVSVGFMDQNQDLLPYSFSSLGGDVGVGGDLLAWNDPDKLPRRTADAKIRTLRFDVDYSVTLIDRLSLRPFFRYYDLDNQTPMSQWRYVTQDVAGVDGSVSYVNFRRNLAYSYNKMNLGMDARYYLTFWRTSINLGFTRENIDREFREANTEENIYEARIRLKPLNLLSLSARYLYGDRQSDSYNYNVTSNSYWYPFELGANQVDNPQFLFANHPDLRKFDVSDRKRTELNLSAGLALMQDLDLTLSFRDRNNDFESDVVPIAPLLGTPVPLPNPADENAMTPGQQLGLLKEAGQNISLNASYLLSERFTVNVFGDMEKLNSDIRGFVFNENQRREPSHPSVQPPNALGPWTDANRIYNAESKQTTNTIGLGFSYELIPGKVRFLADYSLSMTEIDLEYSGYGSDPAFLTVPWETFDFGFNDPETVNYDLYILNASLEYNLFQRFTVGLHYMFSRYLIQDWVEGAEGPWVEQVGSEYFLRDTSRDNRWGNRLVNMGLYLAPTYTAHVGFLTLTYHL